MPRVGECRYQTNEALILKLKWRNVALDNIHWVKATQATVAQCFTKTEGIVDLLKND